MYCKTLLISAIFAAIVSKDVCGDNSPDVQVCTPIILPTKEKCTATEFTKEIETIDRKLQILEEKMDLLLNATAGNVHSAGNDTTSTCGDVGEGWRRVAHLNMSHTAEQCPTGFRLYQQNGVRACGRQSSGCQSVKFPSYGISYSQVCGRVTGYQYGSPDALEITSPRDDINLAYVDGVSITRGNPRKHIWTFMAGLQANSIYSNGEYDCPCAPNSPVIPYSFMGNDYFCESGSPGKWDLTTFHTADPLWDGKKCGLIEEDCCNAPGIPWFNKVLEQPTTDYIELRVCANSAINNEDIPLSYYEIYVK